MSIRQTVSVVEPIPFIIITCQSDLALVYTVDLVVLTSDGIEVWYVHGVLLPSLSYLNPF